MSDRSKKKKEKKKRPFIRQFSNFYGVILRLFEESKEGYLYKNQIHKLILKKKKERRTGLNDFSRLSEFQPYLLEGVSSKEYCFGAIRKLQINKLIEEVEVVNTNRIGSDDYRQDRFRLAENGKKISKLLKEMDEYQENYFQLEQSVREKIPPKSRKELKELGRYNSGWKDKDIEFYHIYRSNALDLIDLMDKNFIGILLLRYSKIIDNHLFSNNKNAKMILNDVIIKVFENKINFILEKYKVYEESANVRGVENYRNPINQIPQYEEKYESGLYGQLPFYMDIVNFFNYKIAPQMIEKVITKMILSYLKLLEFPKERIAADDIDFFLKNKKKLMKDHVIQNRQRDTANTKIEYDYDYLIKIRFDTQELFQKILHEYIE